MTGLLITSYLIGLVITIVLIGALCDDPEDTIMCCFCATIWPLIITLLVIIGIVVSPYLLCLKLGKFIAENIDNRQENKRKSSYSLGE